MTQQLKFPCPLRLYFELNERARNEGRPRSEIILRAVERGLASLPNNAKMPDAMVDHVERRRGRSTACYLSQPLASAIRQLAEAEDRSASWIMRSLIREGLRQRGLLPTPQHQPVDAAEFMRRDAEQRCG